jgi:biotin transport system substrate-specific component
MTVHVPSAPGALLATVQVRPAVQVPVRAIAVLLAVALTAAAAQFTLPLPFTAVPFVLTPFAVMLTGAALGARLGFLSQFLYLAAGAAGLAVFAPSVVLPPGVGRLVGPTGGYLMAYPVAAFVTGWLAERGWDRHYLSSLASMFAGLAVIYIGGIGWLMTLPGQSLTTAIAGGLAPYLLLDVVKAAVAAKLLPLVWLRLNTSKY